MHQFINIISTWILPVLISVTMHEAAHGYTANLLGDDTAKKLGRVTLNPFKHIDRFGTIILPLILIIIKSPFLFGWAKPVPVNFYNLKKSLNIIERSIKYKNLSLKKIKILNFNNYFINE